MRVTAICPKEHAKYPMFYPTPGTVGEVLGEDGDYYSVEWPVDSVNYPHIWYIVKYLVKEVQHEY